LKNRQQLRTCATNLGGRHGAELFEDFDEFFIVDFIGEVFDVDLCELTSLITDWLQCFLTGNGTLDVSERTRENSK
jgi:hypothetical protein